MISVMKTSAMLSMIWLYIQFSVMAGSFASVTPSRYRLARSSDDNTVIINGPQSYWCVLPFLALTFGYQSAELKKEKLFSLIVPK